MRTENLKSKFTLIEGGLIGQVPSSGQDLHDFGTDAMAETMFGSGKLGVRGTRVYREEGNVVFIHEYIDLPPNLAPEQNQNSGGVE